MNQEEKDILHDFSHDLMWIKLDYLYQNNFQTGTFDEVFHEFKKVRQPQRLFQAYMAEIIDLRLYKILDVYPYHLREKMLDITNKGIKLYIHLYNKEISEQFLSGLNN